MGSQINGSQINDKSQFTNIFASDQNDVYYIKRSQIKDYSQWNDNFAPEREYRYSDIQL